MKNKAKELLKRVVSLVTSIAKAKSMAIKSKTSAAKARLIMFSLMKNRKVLVDSISDKIHNLLRHEDDDDQDELNDGDQSKAIVLYNAMHSSSEPCYDYHYSYADNDGDNDGKYPDLRHTLFDEEEMDLEEDQAGSIIDMVRNSKEEEGQDFSLEEEIDHVADLFIKRFHKQMRLQKLQSFKRFQEMLARGVWIWLINQK